MSDIAIQGDRLSKLYRIGALQRHNTLRDHIVHGVKALFQRNGRGRTDSDTIWALKDVSFDIKRGEVVGIIGRNGAGKSTLLKILSRITEPTSGHAKIYGRVGALLEVGTGFHSELTGRENTYLSGAILGMTRAEIKRKFDEIVAFAEIEKFLDTPVKRYSSGMYVRLAFAVAAHLEPEVLIVDEVLAVGDAEFQKKCLGRMSKVASEGRTVLFVSHNMGSIAELCTRCIRLSDGRIVAEGMPQQVIEDYLTVAAQGGEVELREWSGERSGEGPMRVTTIATCDASGRSKSIFKHGDTTKVRFRIQGPPQTPVVVGVSIRNNLRHLVLHYTTTEDGAELVLPECTGVVELIIPENVLNDGQYFVSVWLGDDRGRLHDKIDNALSFEVNSSADGRVRAKGMVRLPGLWSIGPTDSRSSLVAQHVPTPDNHITNNGAHCD